MNKLGALAFILMAGCASAQGQKPNLGSCYEFPRQPVEEARQPADDRTCVAPQKVAVQRARDERAPRVEGIETFRVDTVFRDRPVYIYRDRPVQPVVEKKVFKKTVIKHKPYRARKKVYKTCK